MARDAAERPADGGSPRMSRLGLRNAILAAVPALRRAGLLGPLFRLYERASSLHLAREPKLADGLPVPPRHLRMLVAGTDLEAFLDSGRRQADRIAALFEATGPALDSAGAVLDFGLGCGRVARHWQGLSGAELHGCDYNARLVAWCAANLPHVRAARNDIDPPLPYPDATFGGIYAISVFTHLDEDRQRAWMSELTRVLAPGGRLLLTVHGAATREFMTEAERTRFDAGEPVVRFDEHAGSNLCSTYHPREWVERELLASLEPLRFEPGGGDAPFGAQDVFLAVKPAGQRAAGT